ncbi:telomere binding protein [Mortierella sp. GBA30]|nr:telomere binding protein [Mortierella sp. GBA30]
MLVKHASTEYQKFVSHQLLLMLGYFNAKELLSMDTIPLFNAGMGNWLELENFGRKRISLVVAEEFARTIDTTGSSADFELDTSDPEIQFARSLVELKDGYVPFTLSAASQEEAAKTAAIINVDIQPRSTAMLPDDDGLAQQPADSDDEEDPDAILDPFARVTVSKDSDGETSDESDDDDLKPYDMEYESDPDEDPEAVRKPKVAAPLYLRDLLSYIRASEDRAKVQVGLQTGEELIRRKAGSLELEEYAEDLANTFCLLQDNFDTPNFYKLREGVLVALVVTAPVASVGVLTEQFYAKKNSQGQRMNILNTLGRGAEELSGLDPSIAASSSASQDAAGFSVKNGTTRQQTRQSPTSLSVGTAATTLTPHKPTFESISTSIAIEKTRRFSQKSQIEARRVAPKANAFANLAPVFLGGLLGRWGGNRGPGAERGYDTMLRAPAMLLKKFVLTIACLVHFAGNSPHLLPITRELFQFLLTIRYHSPPVQPKPGHLPPGLSATHPEAFLSSVMTAATLAEQPLTSLKLPGDIGISSTGPSERAISQVSSTVPYNAELVENILFGLLILVTPSPAALSDELLLAEFYPEIMECQQWAMELWEEQRLKESEDKTKMYCAGLLQRCFELLKIS